MFTLRPSPTEAMPRGLRTGVNILIILGVFAMHNLIVGSDGQTQPHHDSMAMSQVADTGAATVTDLVSVSVPSDAGGAMSDCGGLMALCLAMIIGVSAFLIIRQRSRDRVMWQLPPPTIGRAFAPIPPFNSRSPLQRSSVLRC